MIPLRESLLTDELTEREIPSRDYYLNFETGRIDGFVQGKDALRQAAEMRLRTPTGVYPMFSAEYGVGDAGEYLTATPEGPVRLKNRIRRTLCDDDRIRAVEQFVLTQRGNSLAARFVIVTQEGEQEGVYGDG